jgi:hypothetical protein
MGTISELPCPANAGYPVTPVPFVKSSRAQIEIPWLLGRPPEFIIGPAKGRTRWRTMTAESHHLVPLISVRTI